jgi:hypothetical protein
LRRVIGGKPRLKHEIPMWALHPQSVVAQRVEMFPARNQCHLLSRLGQPPSYISADRTGSKNGNAHKNPPMRRTTWAMYDLVVIAGNLSCDHHGSNPIIVVI